LPAPGLTVDQQKELSGQQSFFRQEVERYQVEKKGIQQDATMHQDIARAAAQQENIYDIATGFYQSGIALIAIALIARSRSLWLTSCIATLIGLSLSAYAFSLPTPSLDPVVESDPQERCL
jgi:hypothetical protein